MVVKSIICHFWYIKDIKAAEHVVTNIDTLGCCLSHSLHFTMKISHAARLLFQN